MLGLCKLISYIYDNRHRGARRGSAGFRGGRGGSRGGFSRRLDRHSGSERTGVKAVEKKEGFGSHNWGGQIDAQLNNSTQPDNKADVNELSEGAVKDGDQEMLAFSIVS